MRLLDVLTRIVDAAEYMDGMRFTEHGDHVHGLLHVGFVGDKQQFFDLRHLRGFGEFNARGRPDERNTAEIDERVERGGLTLRIAAQRIHPPSRIILMDFSVQTD